MKDYISILVISIYIVILGTMEGFMKDHWQIIMLGLLGSLLVVIAGNYDKLTDRHKSLTDNADKLYEKLDDIANEIRHLAPAWDIGLKEGEHEYEKEDDPSIHRTLLDIRDELRGIAESLNKQV